jgi:hypothetical protein
MNVKIKPVTLLPHQIEAMAKIMEQVPLMTFRPFGIGKSSVQVAAPKKSR